MTNWMLNTFESFAERPPSIRASQHAESQLQTLSCNATSGPQRRQARRAPVGDDHGRAALLRAERERAPGAARAQHDHAAAGQRARAAQARLHRVQRSRPVRVVRLQGAQTQRVQGWQQPSLCGTWPRP